jgi:Bacterial capsule synthesis protein PGA_cap
MLLSVGEAAAAPPCAPWRFAVVTPPFEPVVDISFDKLVEKWRAGAIAADTRTVIALAPLLGTRGTGPATWSIIGAHEVTPDRGIVSVGGKQPIAEDVLVGEVCGPGITRNIDPAKLTSLVISGTTAMTGRTAERIDTHGIADITAHIAPFFKSADLVHISNEVSFVKTCKPRTGQDTLIFCSRDRYIELLEALHTKIVELTGSHLTDYGDRPLARTIAMYETRSWAWFGGGRTQVEATAPRFVEHHGNRLAFVGCNAVNAWVRHLSRGLGTAACDWARMKWQLQDLRRRGFFPIATVQHRELRNHAPPPDLVRDLRGLAEAGARFVLGSQAHVAHPWDVHHGAYVHYGPGNLLFAQYRARQREASVDKLFIYDNRLLGVAHIFVRTEHGQPRPLDDAERTAFLGALARAATEIAPPSPDAPVALPAATRERPDSLLVRGRNQYLQVMAPAAFEPDKRYPLVVDIEGTQTPPTDAFYVKPLGVPYHTEPATSREIADYMREKYPVDIARLSIAEEVVKKKKKRRRRRSS